MNRISSLVQRRLNRKFSVHSASYKLPTYQHDQCERSLYMHLFAMRKTDLTLVLILTVAFEAFCVMLATLAPDSTIREQMATEFPSSPNNPLPQTKDSPSSPSSADRHYLKESLGINLDLDLEPPSAGTATKERIVAETKTKPLGALNRDLNFRTQLEFGISLAQRMRQVEGNDNIGLSNSSASKREMLMMMLKVSYQIELSLERIVLAQEAGNNGNAKENKGCDDGDDDTEAVRDDDSEATETSCKSNSRVSSDKKQACKSILVSFGCQFVAGMRLSTELTDLLEPPSPIRLKCLAPCLVARHKIERHNERQAYKLTMTIRNISLQESPASASSIGNSTSRIGRVKLDWIKPMVTLRYVNSSFSVLINFTHLLYVLISTTVACSFVLCLSDYSYELWSLEQKWTALMLVLLVGANRPMSSLELLLVAATTSSSSLCPSAEDVSSSLSGVRAQIARRRSCLERLDTSQSEDVSLPLVPLPRDNFDLLDAILGLNFLCGLLLSWTCFVHSIRQISRPFWQFYAPKLALVLLLWLLGFSAILYDSGLLRWQTRLVTQSPVRLDTILKISLAAYFVQLVYHFAISAIELRPMSYFTIRFRVQALLCAWILANYIAIILLAPKMLVSSPAKSSSSFGQPALLDSDRLESVGAPFAVGLASGGDEGGQGADESTEAAGLLTERLNNGTLGQFGLPTTPKATGPAPAKGYSSVSIVQANLSQQQYSNDNDCSAGDLKDSSELPDEELGEGPADVLELLPQNHSFDSACSFLCYIFINNLYVMACAYFYWPMVRQSPLPSCKLLSISRHTNEQDSESPILEDPS